MTTILIKKRDTTGAPGTADLTNAAGGTEIAVNTYDKRIYTKNGSNVVVELGTNPSSLSVANASVTALSAASANITTLTGGTATMTSYTDSVGKVRAIPSYGAAVTTAYTLSTSNVGEFVTIGASGSIIVPNDIFTAGDAVSIFNNTSSAASINFPITTAYLSGIDSDKASVTISSRGIATVLFVNPSLCVISGSVV